MYTSSAKTTLGKLKLSPRKALGQHFLIAQSVVADILQAADIQDQDTVVEIGPGLGVMTQELVKLCSMVIAVELDTDLATSLRESLSSSVNLKVLCADARKLNIDQLTGKTPYKLVANLPYYAASHILRCFLESSTPPKRAVVMMQREVAKNMVAHPGHMSIMSVGIQLYGKPRIVKYVPPGVFYPRPKVTSAVVCIDVYPKPALDLDNREEFFRVVRAGFSAPRKQLRNAISHGMGIPQLEAIALLENAGIDSRARAERLCLQDWGALYDQVRTLYSPRLKHHDGHI